MIRALARPAILAAIASLALAGCASKEDRVRAGLLDLGLSQRSANCLAPPLARDLSTDELRRLGSLAHLKDRDWRAMNTQDLLRHLAVLDEPHILTVTSRAALGCALSF